MTDRLIRRSVILAGAVAFTMLVGCNDKKHKLAPGVQFRPDGEARQMNLIMEQQAAAGARSDGMLYGHHFDGGKLNSLGDQKLDLMMKDDDTAIPMMVYLNIGKNDQLTASRTEAVQAYLRDHGLQASAFTVQVGSNPYNFHSAHQGLTRLPKTENPPLGGGGAGPAAGGAGGEATVPVAAP